MPAERAPRRFLLIDLTPRTRTLFRAFRDAQRAAHALAKPMWDAHSRLADARATVQWAREHPAEVPPERAARYAAEMAEREGQHDAATRAWEAAVEAAGGAFRAAQGPMQAEGYPVSWWHGGAMRLPADVASPGAWRRDPHLRQRRTTAKQTIPLGQAPA
jgi:hypothetical protein